MEKETIKEEKKFTAGVDGLYKAWTDEKALKTWWHPGGRKLEAVTADLEEGGDLIYNFEKNEQSNGDLKIEGKYETVDPAKKLVYTWNWKLDNAPVENGEYRLTVEFSGDKETSEIHIEQEGTGNTQAIHPHKDGWGEALNSLEKYLAKA